MPRVLSAADIDRFLTVGHVVVPQAFPADAALAAQDHLWGKLHERGVARDDRTTWRNPMEFIAENYDGPPFDACATRRLADACVDLVGDGRWFAQHQTGYWGWWPVNFAVGADQPWDVPTEGWHYDTADGATVIDSNDQGLLVICLFSEIKPRGGGTLVVDGSHRVVTRFFRDHPGLPQQEGIAKLLAMHPYLRALTGLDAATGSDADLPRVARFMQREWRDAHDALQVSEITGSPGDVVLCHPFTLHAPSQNHAGTPRFMCNRKAPLFERLQLDRADGGHSPLEESIRRAIAGTAA